MGRSYTTRGYDSSSSTVGTLNKRYRDCYHHEQRDQNDTNYQPGSGAGISETHTLDLLQTRLKSRAGRFSEVFICPACSSFS